MPIISILFVAITLLSACSGLKQAYPLLPVAEYEKMIVGRLDADYVGDDNCVAKCHTHDKIREFSRLSVHGEQINSESGLPLVNCESCHGPGSLAIAKIEQNVKLLGEKGNRCDTTKLIDLKRLPPQAQSLACLKCHTLASTPSLSHWNTSVHAQNELSCSSCHKLHEGPQQKVSHEKMAELCYSCHPDVRSQFSLMSHHPMRERKMDCFDCHDAHGSTSSKMLKGNNSRDLCGRCHMEKSGPFVYGHGDVTDSCMNCHAPHGSVNRRLLTAPMPFLCVQCHNPGHPGVLNTSQNKLFANRCTDCHSAIHGSNSPSPGSSGAGTLRR